MHMDSPSTEMVTPSQGVHIVLDMKFLQATAPSWSQDLGRPRAVRRALARQGRGRHHRRAPHLRRRVH